MGESALLVSFNSHITRADNRKVHNLYNHLLAAEVPGLLDLVPAYSSLLIIFDPSRVEFGTIGEAVARLAAIDPLILNGHSVLHTIPVQYGGDAGPDLHTLAADKNLTIRDVIQLHKGKTYDVFFLGFMPGFAYMGSLSRKIAAPRLATPRVRVPAGSVGIADTQTSIYPFRSPGGWRLIGRTGVSLWDSSRAEPALFTPGDQVSFVETDTRQEPLTTTTPVPDSPRPAFRVTTPGTFTTIQDLGRPGHGSIGLPHGGALDREVVIRANSLVGNSASEGVLEMTWTGPVLEVLRTVTIALDGSDFKCVVDGRSVPPRLSWLAREGSTIRFEQARPQPGRARSYLAVSGGIDVPLVLGSRSTYLPANLGGYGGRALQAGDLIAICEPIRPANEVAGRFLDLPMGESSPAQTVLRFTPYLGDETVDQETNVVLASKSWKVSQLSDRMGIRLVAEDDVRLTSFSRQLVSFGVVRGAIQLPPDGNPVILSADHQTTGGYPVPGVVAEADWPSLAHLVPGDSVRFQAISFEEALKARACMLGARLPNG